MLEAAYPGDIHLRRVSAFQKSMLSSGTDLQQLSVAMLGPRYRHGTASTCAGSAKQYPLRAGGAGFGDGDEDTTGHDSTTAAFKQLPLL